TATAPTNLSQPGVIPAATPSFENTNNKTKKSIRLTLWPLVAATFFMVSGGTYGTEDIVHGAGYGRGILILLLTPLLWSLPTAFMIGELSSSAPAEGGYYAWVRRAMGPFWGFQEAWLSLVASIFDMAIYPTLFVTYLTRLVPWFGEGHRMLTMNDLLLGHIDRGVMVGIAMVLICAIMNIAGVRAVADTSLALFVLLSAPFAILTVVAPFRHAALIATAPPLHAPDVGFLGGSRVCVSPA